MDDLKDRLVTALKNLELLTEQLRETQDYSAQSEMTFLLKELVEEQFTTGNHENTANPASTAG